MQSQPEQGEQSFKDYCLILQLHPEADAAMMDTAYWHLARRYNAERSTDPSAKAKLDDLNEAYSVLRSPARREAYFRIRDAILGEGALPAPAPPEPKPLPLAVMEKQRPRSREDAAPQRRRRPRLNFAQVNLPPWQSGLAALIMLTLASTALVAWAHPALVAALVVGGVGLTTLPLARRLPHLPTLSALRARLSAPAAPHSSEQPPGRTAVDPDSLSQSTAGMRARWREGVQRDDSSTELSTKPDVPEKLPQAANDEDSSA